MTDSGNGKLTVLKFQSSGTPQKSYVKCGNNPALKFDGSEPYTLTARIFLKDGNGTIMSSGLGSHWDGSGDVKGYCVLPLGDRLRAYRAAEPYDCDTDKISYLNRWVHIIITFDSGTYSVYLDGKLAKTVSGFQPIESGPADLEFLIGTMYRGDISSIGNCFGYALIHSMAVLSTGVTETDVPKVMALSSNNADYPIVALWDFTTKTAKDLSGNGNDGTLMGTAEFIEVEIPDESNI